MSVSAPGKTILFGEHAVVYGQPALAAPLLGVELKVAVTRTDKPCRVEVPGVSEDRRQLFQQLVGILLEATGWELRHNICLSLASTIPVGCGLGSSAALSVALTEALAQHLGEEISVERVCELAYELEKVFHGTPSGVDNTVVAYRQAVYFRRGEPPQRIVLGDSYRLLVANTGVVGHTAELVAEVRELKEAQPERIEPCLEEIGEVVDEAREILERGASAARLGELMNRNQELLARLTVSAPCNDRLIEAALSAGAHGAKLTGAGRGGNVIALVAPGTEETVRQALASAGARGVWSSVLEPLPEPRQGHPYVGR